MSKCAFCRLNKMNKLKGIERKLHYCLCVYYCCLAVSIISIMNSIVFEWMKKKRQEERKRYVDINNTIYFHNVVLHRPKHKPVVPGKAIQYSKKMLLFIQIRHWNNGINICVYNVYYTSIDSPDAFVENKLMGILQQICAHWQKDKSF